MAQFFFDNQIRRFLIQFARIFSDWQVTKGKDPAGNDILIRVPIQYGDSSRMAQAQISNNSPSSLPSAPLITYNITGLDYDQSRTQDPYFIDKLSIRQRSFNQDTGLYEQTQGQAYSVERLMPVPYKLSVNVDFWTTNYNQKLELVEQLGTLFNPALEIQSTDNFIDWTSLSVVYQDGLTFSSRSIPQGSGNAIDIMSWKFHMPIWISGPAKIKKLGVIQKIVTSIFQGAALTDMKDSDLLLGTREKFTPYGYKLLLIGDTLQILPGAQVKNDIGQTYDVVENPDTGLYWSGILDMYGKITNGISQVWLQNPYMTTDIVGTISINPTDDRLLLYDIDTGTLPSNTLDPVTSIINPQTKGPNHGLPAPANGQRYLLVEDIGHINNEVPALAWGNVVANANDIIQYNASTQQWEVSFDSQIITTVEYVKNLTSSVQYRYTDGVWVKSYEGWYEAGDFSIVI